MGEDESEWNGETRSWHERAKADFSGYNFASDVDFSEFHFPGEVSFRSANFQGDVHFDQCEISRQFIFW